MDQQENAEFINVGMEQPAEVERHDDVVIKVDGPSNGKGWKIAAICAIVAVVGLCAGLVFVLMHSNDSSKKVDDVQAKLDASTEELNRFREVTGVDAAADYVSNDDYLNIDFTELYNSIPKESADMSLVFALEGAYMKQNGDYQIATFGVGEVTNGSIGGGYTGHFYRALPDGEWKFSNYSGQAQPVCSDLTEEEQAAFDGVLECAE
ncbi:MAG: hypothetical protein ACK5MU_00660 [Candidatus Saccharimonadales bacterium]